MINFHQFLPFYENLLILTSYSTYTWISFQLIVSLEWHYLFLSWGSPHNSNNSDLLEVYHISTKTSLPSGYLIDQSDAYWSVFWVYFCLIPRTFNKVHNAWLDDNHLGRLDALWYSWKYHVYPYRPMNRNDESFINSYRQT